MIFILKPSLQHIAIVKIVSTLRIQDDISGVVKDSYDNCTTGYKFCWTRLSPEIRQERVEMVLEKVKKLHLPKFFEEKILNVVKPMPGEIEYWIYMHDHYDIIEVPIWNKDFLRWTCEGTVDFMKTAEMLVQDEELDIIWRYSFACTYCLDCEIPKLWNKLPESKREHYIEGSVYELEFYNHEIHWALRMKEASGHATMIPEWYSWSTAFYYLENVETIKYALQKLTPEEREKYLLRTTISFAKHVTNSRFCKVSSNILLFLLSQLSENEQMTVVQKFPYSVLKSLLHWPRQCLFLETSNNLWHFLPLEDFLELIVDIINTALKCKDYDYKELFREFWQQSPVTYKKLIFQSGEFLMSRFIKDMEIEENFKNARCDGKNELNSELICGQYILYMIENEKWNLLISFYADVLNQRRYSEN